MSRGKVTLVLGLHNHQPVGNFDHVFEEAYSKAYLPFIEVLDSFPHIPFVLHNSGVLWNWLVEHHPEYMKLLRSMSGRGQIEIMSGGYYEPILSVIPERDRQGQLRMMRDFLTAGFDSQPRGCWLTERIWEPHLPLTLSRAGLEYVVVDDAHFKSTGFSTEEMRGFFLSEEDGAYIRIFPIDKKLRYLIPFAAPEEAIRYLRSIADEPGEESKIVVLADDGEKFGLWPGTHKRCYEEGWLARMCGLLAECGDWLNLSTFSGVIDAHGPIGIVYLPTASYSEMMEWALPLEAGERYSRAVELLSAAGSIQDPKEMVRGGFWRNFLVKYEESNCMHKRMIAVSENLERAGKKSEKALDHLYQAQCNCAYWHGLFGGLYLPHLRSAVFTHLIEAENAAATAAERTLDHEVRDIDGDGVDELIVSGRHLQAFFKARGGSLRELDIRSPAFNVTDTLTRRREIYHKDIAGFGNPSLGEPGGAVSIHDITAAKENGLERFLRYDDRNRESLLDHFIGADTTLDAFAGSSYRELGDFLRAIYRMEIGRSGKSPLFVFERRGRIETEAGKSVAVDLVKGISMPQSAPRLDVEYTVRPIDGSLDCRFAVESVFSLLAGDAPDRYFEFPGRSIGDRRLASMGEEKEARRLSLVDEWLGIEIGLEFEPAALVWRYPIETVSNSESGFERVYQGSVVAAVWPLLVKRGKEARFSIRLSVERRSGRKG
jgi:hypothetical protein